MRKSVTHSAGGIIYRRVLWERYFGVGKNGGLRTFFEQCECVVRLFCA